MIYLLRENPCFTVELFKDSFIITDDKRLANNGTYAYDNLKQVNYSTQKINWWITLFSFITDPGFGDVYRDKVVLHIQLKRKSIKTHAKDFKIIKTKAVVRQLKMFIK